MIGLVYSVHACIDISIVNEHEFWMSRNFEYSLFFFYENDERNVNTVTFDKKKVKYCLIQEIFLEMRITFIKIWSIV